MYRKLSKQCSGFANYYGKRNLSHFWCKEILTENIEEPEQMSQGIRGMRSRSPNVGDNDDTPKDGPSRHEIEKHACQERPAHLR